MDNKKIALVQELEAIFENLNEVVFDKSLKMPIHVFQPKKKDVFRFHPESFHMVIGTGFIKMIPDDFENDDDMKLFKEKLVEEYVHEMCHVRNRLNNKEDCTSNQYHNKKFLETALDAGFYVGRRKNQGYSITSLTVAGVEDRQPSLLRQQIGGVHAPKVVNNKILNSAVDEVFIDTQTLSQAVSMFAPQKKKKFFLRYECGCGSSFRSGIRPTSPNAIDAVCNKCKSNFKCVEEY